MIHLIQKNQNNRLHFTLPNEPQFILCHCRLKKIHQFSLTQMNGLCSGKRPQVRFYYCNMREPSQVFPLVWTDKMKYTKNSAISSPMSNCPMEKLLLIAHRCL